MKVAERLYRVLLKAYPSRFAEKYGEDMAQLFGDRVRDARSWKQQLHVWWWAIRDYLPSLCIERLADFRGRPRGAPVPVRTVVRRIVMFSPSFAAGLIFMGGFIGYRAVRAIILHLEGKSAI